MGGIRLRGAKGDRWVVICRDDKVGRRTPPYVLATRQVFGSREAAETYAATVHPSRKPLVIEGRWGELRLPPPSPAEEF